jgi:hypothetical protein
MNLHRDLCQWPRMRPPHPHSPVMAPVDAPQSLLGRRKLLPSPGPRGASSICVLGSSWWVTFPSFTSRCDFCCAGCASSWVLGCCPGQREAVRKPSGLFYCSFRAPVGRVVRALKGLGHVVARILGRRDGAGWRAWPLSAAFISGLFGSSAMLFTLAMRHFVGRACMLPQGLPVGPRCVGPPGSFLRWLSHPRWSCIRIPALHMFGFVLARVDLR